MEESTGQPAAAAVEAATDPAATAATVPEPVADDGFVAAFTEHASDRDTPDRPTDTDDARSAPPGERPRNERGQFVSSQPPRDVPPETAPPAAPSTDPDAQYRSFVERYEREQAEAAAAATRERSRQQHEDAELEAFRGKSGELAALLDKRAQAHTSGQWGDFTSADEERLTWLTTTNKLAQPLYARALAEARAELGAAADAGVNGLMAAWAEQQQAATRIALPGLTAEAVNAAQDIPGFVMAGYRARDGEVEDLKAQLDEARGLAFRSAPPLVGSGGASPGTAAHPALGPDASAQDTMVRAFELAARTGQNGRRS